MCIKMDLLSSLEASWSWSEEARKWWEEKQLYCCHCIAMVRYGIKQSWCSTTWLAITEWTAEAVMRKSMDCFVSD